ncbi:MAG TPA: hypothetical protein VF943_07495 [Burkholderiales bacterium]
MNARTRQIAIIAAAMFATGCSGVPVSLGSQVSGPIPTGPERQVQSRNCGFQLLGVIPIMVNDRQSRAYEGIETQAAGGFISDVRVTETWSWWLIGVKVCTTLNAKVIQAQGSAGAGGNQAPAKR